jgi:hypothetical protein
LRIVGRPGVYVDGQAVGRGRDDTLDAGGIDNFALPDNACGGCTTLLHQQEIHCVSTRTVAPAGFPRPDRPPDTTGENAFLVGAERVNDFETPGVMKLVSSWA